MPLSDRELSSDEHKLIPYNADYAMTLQGRNLLMVSAQYKDKREMNPDEFFNFLNTTKVLGDEVNAELEHPVLVFASSSSYWVLTDGDMVALQNNGQEGYASVPVAEQIFIIRRKAEGWYGEPYFF